MRREVMHKFRDVFRGNFDLTELEHALREFDHLQIALEVILREGRDADAEMRDVLK